MKYTQPLTTAAPTQKLCNAVKASDTDFFLGSFFVTGTFGSGTVTLNGSMDGGVTLIPLKDVNGSAISLTAAGMFTFMLGTSNNINDQMELYASIAGSTGASVNATLFDNR